MGVTCNQFGGNSISKALNANVYGSGSKTLVLAHGFGSDQSSWHFLIPYLVCYFKVVVFDMVFAATVDPELYDEKRYSGSFDGYAEDLVCLLDELNIKNSIYVGHSMSAMIGGLASSKRPHLFNQLVLYSGSPRYLNDTNYNGGFNMEVLNETFKAMKEDYPSWVKSFAPKAVAITTNDGVAEFERTLGGMRPSVALSVAETVFLSDFRCILPRISVPSLIIQSREDVIVPNSVAFYMKRKLCGVAKMEILETKGHFPHLTAYHLLLEALLRGLKIKA